MFALLDNIGNWLGSTRSRLLIALLISTGLVSLIIRAVYPDENRSIQAQTLTLVIFLAGSGLIIGSRMNPDSRYRLSIVAVPSLTALLLSVIVPSLSGLFLGIAVGWVIASQFLLRNTENRDYKMAIKAMRKQDYGKAVDIMTDLIQREPDVVEHYNFRAQLYRLKGDNRRAKSDYKQITRTAPESGIGQNGLAEVYLQSGDLETARRYAEAAYQHVPDDWVAAYNLGMIAERQKDTDSAIRYLNEALEIGLPDRRHRFLILFWLSRCYHRAGDSESLENTLRLLRKEKKALNDWQVIFESEEAAALKSTLADDIRVAEKLVQNVDIADVFAAQEE